FVPKGLAGPSFTKLLRICDLILMVTFRLSVMTGHYQGEVSTALSMQLSKSVIRILPRTPQTPFHLIIMSPETPPSCDGFSEDVYFNSPDRCEKQVTCEGNAWQDPGQQSYPGLPSPSHSRDKNITLTTGGMDQSIMIA
ncbi:hypothetical protein STEG23_014508, partial [Scotinomys teguina]